MKQLFQRLGMQAAMLLAFFPLFAADYDFEYGGFYFKVTSVDKMTCGIAGTVSPTANIEIPSKVTYKGRELIVTSIRPGAFINTNQRLELKSVTIPNSVETIGYTAFRNCIFLESVTIPNSVKTIGYEAFMGCISLKSVTIPNSVTYMGYRVFQGSGLTDVRLPNNLKEIPRSAFEECLSLISVDIPNGVTLIEEWAFKNCSSLTSAIINGSIGNYAFNGCTSLTSATLSDSTARIGEYAFLGCSSLTKIKIPGSVKQIEAGAFRGCTALTELIFEATPNLIDNRDINIFNAIVNVVESGGIKSVTLNRNTIKYIIPSLVANPRQCIPKLESLTLGDSINCCGFTFDSSELKEIEIGKVNEIYTHFGDDYQHTNFDEVRKTIPLRWCGKLKILRLREKTPPEFSVDIRNTQYANISLYVPKGSLKAYQNDENWGKFWEIIEYSDESGVDDIPTTATEKLECGRYDLMGRPATDDYQGITIIKYNDGTTKKCISGR